MIHAIEESYLNLTRTICINIACKNFSRHLNNTFLTITQLSCNNRIIVTKTLPQQAITCSKLTIETVEQGVTYVQS